MKKVSTAAAKQMRNFYEQRLTTGLDLGKVSGWRWQIAPGSPISHMGRSPSPGI